MEQALACYRELKSPAGISWVLYFLTKVALVRGDFLRAQELGEESITIAQREDLEFAWPLTRLGEIAYANGDFDRARSCFEQSMVGNRAATVGNRGMTSAWKRLSAFLLQRSSQKDFDAAHTFLDQWLQIAKRFENDQDPNLCGCYLYRAILVQEEGNIDSAIQWYHRKRKSAGIPVDRDEWSSWGLVSLAWALTLGQHELASRCSARTDAADNENYRMWPIYRADCDRLIEAAQAHLDATVSTPRGCKAKQQPIEQVITEAVTFLEGVLGVEGKVKSA
ncbi:MAG: hypothetical protein H6647_09390 [Anaerolineales bacterium]|nr:hypothetical protein [Anaerolineales bacterium]